MLVELTDFELDMIRGALKNSANELTRYASWVDDRPMLPLTDVAIDRIKEESRLHLKLMMKLLDAEKGD